MRAWTRCGARTRTLWPASAVRSGSWHWRSRRRHRVAGEQCADAVRDLVRFLRECAPGDVVGEVAAEEQVGVTVGVLLALVPVEVLRIELNDEPSARPVGVDVVAGEDDVVRGPADFGVR